MKRAILIWLILVSLSTRLFSQQYFVEGKVIDEDTKQPLAFVSIVINNSHKGGMADIDGKFYLTSNEKIEFLRLSYVGYYLKIYYLKNESSNIVISLKDKQTELSEVKVYPRENPAHRIINLVEENRKINNPEKQHSFSYTSYNKFLVTAAEAEKRDTSYFIADTVKIQKAFEEEQDFVDSTFKIIQQNPEVIPIDSSLIVRILQDTSIMHNVLRAVLTDTTIISKVQSGASLLKGRSFGLDTVPLLPDSMPGMAEVFTMLNSYYNSFFSNPANVDRVIGTVDTLLNNPQVLGTLVPAIEKIFTDTALLNRVLPNLNLQKLMYTQLSKELYKNAKENGFDIEKQHLFIMESVTERRFLKPDNSFENVLATEVSGFQDPLFVLLATQVQSFSFYNNVITIRDKNYVNPISPGSTRKYLFIIEDTLFNGNDTVFVITFQPKRNTNFEALEGVLYINSNTWAIQNVIACSSRKGFLSIKIQQKYEYIEGKQWFPVQLNTEVTIPQAQTSMGSNDKKLVPVGVGRTYIQDIELNPELKHKEFNHIAVDMEATAAYRKEDYWEKYRIAPLDEKEKRTYAFMDSLGKELNFEKYTKSFLILKSGQIPVRFLNIDIKEIIRFNEYEGLRMGLALQTNPRLTDKMQFGGYIAYGFHDKTAKYGGNADFFIHKNMEWNAGIYYSDDVAEHGVQEVYQDNSLFSNAYWRSFHFKDMAELTKYGVYTEFRALNYFKIHGAIDIYEYLSHFNPTPSVASFDDARSYNFTEVSVGTRFAFKEKLIRTPQQQFMQTLNEEQVNTKYPTIWFQYTAGLDLFTGDYIYNRYDLKIEKAFHHRYLGTSNFKVEAGCIDNPVPFVRLYNGRSSFRTFSINVPNSFSTMDMDEFFSNKYASVFFDHNFGNILIRKGKFAPEFHIVTNAAIGSLYNLEDPAVDISSMEEGYYESGICINNLVNLKLFKIGVATYYRYGPYALDNEIDNFSFRFTLSTPF